jgi:hypothetical protein
VSEIDAQAPGQQDLAGARVGALGHGSAGHDLDGLAGADGKIRRLARADLIGQHTAGRLEQRDHFGLAANARLAQFLDDRRAGLLECKRSRDAYSSGLRRVGGVRPIGVKRPAGVLPSSPSSRHLSGPPAFRPTDPPGDPVRTITSEWGTIRKLSAAEERPVVVGEVLSPSKVAPKTEVSPLVISSMATDLLAQAFRP